MIVLLMHLNQIQQIAEHVRYVTAQEAVMSMMIHKMVIVMHAKIVVLWVFVQEVQQMILENAMVVAILMLMELAIV